MSARHKYVKRDTEFVLAVQLDLETAGFTYEKWGGTQTCKAGDWIVNNAGDTYTVDRDSFARTYRATSPFTVPSPLFQRWRLHGEPGVHLPEVRIGIDERHALSVHQLGRGRRIDRVHLVG